MVTRAGAFQNHSSHNLFQLLLLSSGSELHSRRQEKDSSPQTGGSESIWGEWEMQPPSNGSDYSLSPATRQEVSKREQTRGQIWTGSQCDDQRRKRPQTVVLATAKKLSPQIRLYFKIQVPSLKIVSSNLKGSLRQLVDLLINLWVFLSGLFWWKLHNWTKKKQKTAALENWLNGWSKRWFLDIKKKSAFTGFPSFCKFL